MNSPKKSKPSEKQLKFLRAAAMLRARKIKAAGCSCGCGGAGGGKCKSGGH